MDRRLTLVASYSSEEFLPLPVVTESVIAKATKQNIEKAKEFIYKLQDTSCKHFKLFEIKLQNKALFDYNLFYHFFISDGRMLALNIAKLSPEKLEVGKNGRKPESLIVFLTDGLPNVHVNDPSTIVSDVTQSNIKSSSIFSLALG